ncbi:MAG: tape measure protein [Lentisphaeraceae bacterium]|nr:tape measure protein [Lentisphaeraceae bacterium]
MPTKKIEEIVLKVSMEDTKARQNLSGLDGSLNKADLSAKNFSNTMIKLGASILGVVASIKSIQKASSTALDFTRTGNALNQVFKTSERVKQEWQFLSRVSETLGLDIQKLAEQYAQVAAASNDTSLEGKGARDILVGVSTAATALSLSADDTSGALRAINQIISKGKVQAEELRGQLGERLPGAFQIAARAMGMTTQQLDKMLDTGSVLSDDFIPKFANQLKTEFAGGALESANKEIADLNRISNELNETWRRFGVVANSFIPIIANDIIPAVTDAMENLLDTSLDYAEGFLPELLTVAGGVFSGMGTLFSSLGEIASSIFGFIGEGWNLLFTQITGDENWIDKITGFLTVAAQAWPQLISNAFLSIAQVISNVLGKVQRFFQNVVFEVQEGGLIAANALYTTTGGRAGISDSELEAGILDLEERRNNSKNNLNFFEELEKYQEALIEENNKTIQSFAESAEEERGENKKSIKDLFKKLRKNINDVFDINDIKGDFSRNKTSSSLSSKQSKSPSGPIQTLFEKGASATAFLNDRSVEFEHQKINYLRELVEQGKMKSKDALQIIAG